MADKLETDLHFAIVPRWVSRHPALTAQAVRVYTIIADHAGKDGTAYSFNIKIAAGQDTEAIWVGYTVQSIKEE